MKKKEKSWEQIIKRSEVSYRKEHPLPEKTEEEERKQHIFRKLISSLLKAIPIPIIIGLVAVYFYYMNFGEELLKKALLEWIIGITLIATIIPIVMSLFERQKAKIEEKINKDKE